MNPVALLASCLLVSAALHATSPARAGALENLTNSEVAEGLKEALIQGANKAVGQIGKTDGFLQNAKIKIPMPENLAKVESAMRKLRMGKYADELVVTMNRAAETATSEATAMLVDAVKAMTVNEAKSILTGPENAATEYFRKTTSEGLRAKFLPIVEQATNKVQLAKYYDKFAGKAASVGLLKSEQTDLNGYVTQKALDGLYTTIADEEKAIRANPVKRTTSMVQKVFGALIK